MARIYINYSRADTSLVEQLVPLLEHAFPDDTVWYDRDSSTRADWSQQILSEIERCDLFIYLISNESLTAKQCQDEFYEALRLRKVCLSILIRPAADVALAPPEQGQLNWIDMSGGLQDAKANDALIRAVRLQLSSKNLPVTNQSKITAPERTNRRRFWISTVGGMAVIAVLVVTIIFLSIAREPVVGNIFSSTVSLLGGTRTASLLSMPRRLLVRRLHSTHHQASYLLHNRRQHARPILLHLRSRTVRIQPQSRLCLAHYHRQQAIYLLHNHHRRKHRS